MGGYNSGRCRTRKLGNMETAFQLDIRRLRRTGLIVPGEHRTTVLKWRRDGCSDVLAAVEASADLTDPESMWLTIRCAISGQPYEQHIGIVAREMTYGRRLYFVCSATIKRCEVMGFAQGRWASRTANRLSYASQSLTRLDRLCKARAKAEERVLG